MSTLFKKGPHGLDTLQGAAAMEIIHYYSYNARLCRASGLTWREYQCSTCGKWYAGKMRLRDHILNRGHVFEPVETVEPADPSLGQSVMPMLNVRKVKEE